jgi:serine protease Do
VSAIVNGIVIDDVEPGSPADEADLKRGDVIEEINQTAISRVDDFQNVIDRSKREPILMLIARGPNHIFIVVEPRT